MTVQIAIAIGYSNLNMPTINKLLGRHYAHCCFRVERRLDARRHTAFEYEEGKAQAEDLAITLALRHGVPLCIGVVAVRLVANPDLFRPANLEIAVFMERGNLKEPIPLTPRTTHNAACAPWGKHPHESHFNTEAGLNLLEAVQVRHRSLNLV